MSRIIDMINMKLKGKGLVTVEINHLIKDVFNVIGTERYFTTTSVKQALESLGWEGHILDNYVLELILLLLTDEGGFETYRYTVH
ncbi:MAG: hypothetical protein U9R43_11285 [Thermodesulfobacteriota bacterium]|nr:hypothetical protein [Thermodesulfobacteriota bacterium]